MKLPRGFKAHANRIANQFRSELKISAIEPFEPFAAARDLGIPLFEFSMLEKQCNGTVFQLLDDGRVSAMTIMIAKDRRAIFYDDRRPDTRIASDISHELAHALLFHPAHSVTSLGCAGLDSIAEEEASHLAGVLLVSDEAALHVVSASLSVDSASKLFRVSPQMMRYRINVSGAKIRDERRRQRRAS